MLWDVYGDLSVMGRNTASITCDLVDDFSDNPNK